MKAYIYPLIVSAFCCAILLQLVSNPKRKKLIQLVSGTVLAVLVLGPLSNMKIPNGLDRFLPGRMSPESYIAEGEEISHAAQRESIESACEAYILDKARFPGAEISVQVFLNGELIPVSAQISGAADPDQQIQLQTILAMDLGIPKENQKWIWQEGSSSS